MYTSEKSDRPIVPEKPSNKAPSIIANDHGAAEMVEERGLTKGNLLKFDRCRTLRQRLDMENTKRARKANPGYGQVETPTLSQKTCKRA